MQRVWLKITESAGQPELCSGRRLVVVLYKSTWLYIDYYYYLWRNLVPLQRVNRNLFRQSSAPICGHGVAGADLPLAGLQRQRQPRVGVTMLLGGLFDFPARLEEGPEGCRSGRSAGDCRHTRDPGPGRSRSASAYGRVHDAGQHYPAARAAKGH